MDGLKLLLECSSDNNEQNAFYNGWMCDHYVSAVFIFAPDGTIPICCYNYNVPGSVHGSTIATIGGIYDKLKVVYNRCGGLCIIDLAFGHTNHPFLIKSGTERPKMSYDELTIRRDASSLGQSAEWGMCSFQSSFPHLKDPIPFKYHGKRDK